VVQEIAWRSRSATELVLKRLLADDRREEIFVTKVELTKKFEPLPQNLRRVFDPLGLSDEPASPAAKPPVRPLPRPLTEPPRQRQPTLPPISAAPKPAPAPEPATPVVLTSEKSTAAGGEIRIEDADVSSGDHPAKGGEPTVRRD